MINILSIKLTNSGVVNVLSSGITTKKSVKSKSRTLARDILGDVATSNTTGIILKEKFAEKIRIGKVMNGEYCIAFGYNPAYGDPNIMDDTNAYLIGLFENIYEGYYLINLYPNVSPHISTLSTKTNISNVLVDTLIQYEINNLKRDDVYIFAGTKFDLFFFYLYYSALNLYNVYILTDTNNKLKHLSSLKHGAIIHQLI